MSDLQMLYRILDVDVNNLPLFSSATQKSSLQPVSVSEKNSFLEKERAHSLHVKKDIRFTSNDDASVIAYESHPLIDVATKRDVRPKCSGCDNMKCDDCSGSRVQWSALTQIYIGSITVIGLYALFRAIQRSK